MTNKAIVIGAGFSGLSAASNLANKGFNVKVLEKNSRAGGRARKLEKNGFVFDIGPSFYWLPDVFEQYFRLLGSSVEEFYDLVRLDPSYRVFYSKDDIVDLPANLNGIYDLFETIEKGSSVKLKKFLMEAEFKYKLGIQELVYKPGKSILEYADMRVLKGVLKLHVFTSFHKYIRKYFKHPKLHPILEFPIIFLGATPKRTPALYNLMNYADMKLGTWYPMGGIYRVIEGMVKLAENKGVEFIYNAEVNKFDYSEKKITSVHTSDGRSYEADVVIASADYHHIEQEVLDKSFRKYDSKYWDSREMAPSALLFFLGVDKKIEKLQHHNLMFDEDFGDHAEELFEKPAWPEKPLLYVSATSRTDKTVAPPGKENIVVLIPVAPDLDDTEEIRNKYFNYAMDKLEALCGENIRDHLEVNLSYAHNDYRKDYNAYKGNAYGLGNTLKQTGILKPSIQNPQVKNLFYTGQLTTPGPGVPPSIISGQVVASEVLKQYKL